MKSSSITIEDLLEMFPGDDQIIEKFSRFKEEIAETKSSIRHRNNSTDNNFTQNKYRETTNNKIATYDDFNNRSYNKSFD